MLTDGNVRDSLLHPLNGRNAEWLCFVILGFLLVHSHLITAVCAVQPPGDVEQRGLLQRIRETEASLAEKNWLEAVEKFDSAWGMACEKEDPLMVATGADTRQLNAGETESLAGGKAKLEDLFRRSPTAFREEFGRQFSDLAENQINIAIQNGDLNAVRRISVRYSFCPAAQRGIAMLAKLSMDRGDFLEAALLLGRTERLNSQPDPELSLRIALCYSRAGLKSDAIDVVNRLISSGIKVPLTLGGRRLELPVTTDDSEQWLLNQFGGGEQPSQDWLQPGGSYRRSASQSRGPFRYSKAWESDLFFIQDVLYAEEFNPILSEFREPIDRNAVQLLERNSVIVPAATPLVAGELAILRTPFGMKAVRIETGELIWEVTRPESRLKVFVEEMRATDDGTRREVFQPNRMFRANPYVDPLAQLLYQVVRTNTAAQMAINGNTLFVCEESSGATWLDEYSGGIGPDATTSIPSNFIRAYDAVTGLFKWEIGGQSQNVIQPAGRGNLLAGFYFLGSPLVLGRRTYVLAESGEGIFLIQIGEPNPSQADSNPRVISSQLLAIPSYRLPRHPVRKHAGLVPSFAQGLLICPTCDQQIVAVSAEDNSIRWVFRYAGNVRTQEIGGDDLVLFGGRNLMDTRRIDLDSRWIDSLPRIVDSRVLVTPRDSDQLFCLDLISGKELWKTPRGPFHAIAAVTSDRVVLVGNKSVAAIRIIDGSVLWSAEIRDGIVCGTSITNGSVLQVPTNEPAILTLDMETGRILVRQGLDSGKSPGNLMMTRYGMLSQSLTSVTFSKQTKEMPSAADRATELLLDRQALKAKELLERVVVDVPEDKASRELLIEVLLELLRSDFQQHRSNVPRVRELIELSSREIDVAALLHSMLGMNPPDAAVLSRQMRGRAEQHLDELAELIAKGLAYSDSASVTEIAESIDQLLRELPAARRQAVATGFLLRSKASVFLAGIRQALATRSLSERSEIEDALRMTVVETLNSLTSEDAASYFQWALLAAGLSELALIEPQSEKSQLTENPSRLLQEMAQLELSQSASDKAASAVISLLDSWKIAGDRWAIATWLSDVAGSGGLNTALRFQRNDEMVPDAILTDWKSKNPELSSPTDSVWSAAPNVVVSDDRTMLPAQADPDHIPNTFIPLYGAPGVYRGWSFVRLLADDQIAAYDPDGVMQWTFQPPRLMTDANFNRDSEACAFALGHLLVINLRGTLFALDALIPVKDGHPRLLWQKDIERLASDAESEAYRRYEAPSDRLPQFFPQPAGFYPVGPVTSFGVPVISGRRLMVFNPLNGTRNWQTEGIPRDAVMLCSEDTVLLLSETSRQIEVRSLLDGNLKSVVRLPEWWGEANANVASSVRDIDVEPGIDLLWRIFLQGRSCVLFRLTGGSSKLESRDLLTDTVIWSIELPEDSVFSNVDEDVVAVLSEGKQLKLIEVDTGRILVDTVVTKVPEPRELILRESHGHYLVLPEAVEDPSLELDPVLNAMHVYGRIYAIRKDSLKLAWDEALDHRHIRLTIPERNACLPNAPIVVLLSRGGEVNPQTQVQRSVYGVRVVDVRTGKDLYRDNDVGTTLNQHWLKIDAANRKLTLSFDRRIITLDYSGE